MTSADNIVAVHKCEEPAEGALKVLSSLEEKGSLRICPQVVFLKPNIAVPVPFDVAPSEITAPTLVGFMVRYFRERGAKKVIVGESPAWGASSYDALKASGVAEIVTKNGGVLCDLDTEPDVRVQVDGHVFSEISVPKAIAEADLFVNLAKAKTHFLTGVTAGIKNLFGCVRYEFRKKYHREIDLVYVLADLVKALSPNLTLVDAVQAMEGFGPHAGTAVRMGLVIGGANVVAVDTVTTYLMGFDPKSLGILQVAHKLGLGEIDIANVNVVGEKADEVQKKLQPPIFQLVSQYANVNVYAGGVCPGCRPRIPVVPSPCDPSQNYAIIIGREPIAMRADVEADEIWLVGNCGVRAGMAWLLRKAFLGGFKKGVPKVVKVPGCPPLDWFSQKVIFPPLREKGWMH